MEIKWYMDLSDEEINALITYHREQQYASANHEDYSDAAQYKQRADKWASFAGKSVKVVEEA
jgi:hypothetical protein